MTTEYKQNEIETLNAKQAEIAAQLAADLQKIEDKKAEMEAINAKQAEIAAQLAAESQEIEEETAQTNGDLLQEAESELEFFQKELISAQTNMENYASQSGKYYKHKVALASEKIESIQIKITELETALEKLRAKENEVNEVNEEIDIKSQ